jgi:hypothetical protein
VCDPDGRFALGAREPSSSEGTLAQVSIYGVAAARWSILGGTALVRLGRLFLPHPREVE